MIDIYMLSNINKQNISRYCQKVRPDWINKKSTRYFFQNRMRWWNTSKNIYE